MVYARTVEGRALTFQVSGMLWRNSLVMVDRETGTWWSHVTGEGLRGDLAGRRLEMLPSVQTSWREWREAHPDTLLLAKSAAVQSSRYERYFADPERTGLFRSRWLMERMPGKALVWGVARGVHAVAVTDDVLQGDGLVMTPLGDEPVVVARGPAGGVRAFVARASGRDLELTRGGAQGLARDDATGSRWNLGTGRAVSGELEGATLEELPVTRVFWFAWSSFYPNTSVLDDGGE